jgi:CheY-like chemotaxis protein
VLLADDHLAVLRSVSRLLAADFNVVAAVGDGSQALEASRRLDPDVVVLDVTMPGLDGFQTAQELKRIGSRAKIVFLSMHEAEEFVATAVASGGSAYVLKTRIRLDLPSAVNHALAQRLFVPSLASLLAVVDGRGAHAVQFYANSQPFLNEVSRFLGLVLRRRDPAVVLAAGPNRVGLMERLEASGVDVAGAIRARRLLVMDAAEAVSQIMRDGRVDPERVAEMIDDLERLRVDVADGPGSRLTIVGEVAVLLCRHGNFEAAIQLERLWDDLTRPLPFLTVCGYSIDCLRAESDPELLFNVCAHHSAVTHASSAGIATI